MKKLFQILVLAVVSLGFAACDKDVFDNAVWHTWKLGINAEQDITQLEVGKTLQLEAVIIPTFANVTDVTWTSDNEDVATVSAKGLVTATGPGKVTITVFSNYDPDIRASLKLTAVYGVAPIGLDNTDPIDQSKAQSRKK